MNSSAFGSEIWRFIHQWVDSFPNEVLSIKESMAAIHFTKELMVMLPCKYCRNSAKGFLKELNLWKSLMWKHPISGKYFMTRTKLSQFFVTFHNKVNHKLESPIFVYTPIDSYIEYKKRQMEWKYDNKKEWLNCLFNFLFACCWNYPIQDPTKSKLSKYYKFFIKTLPDALAHIPEFHNCLMQAYKEYHFDKQETLISRTFLTRWIYHIRKYIHVHCSDFKFELEFHQLDIIVEAFRARSKSCQIDQVPVSANDTNQTCK